MNGAELLIEDLKRELQQIRAAQDQALYQVTNGHTVWESYRKTVDQLSKRREVVQARLERLVLAFATPAPSTTAIQRG